MSKDQSSSQIRKVKTKIFVRIPSYKTNITFPAGEARYLNRSASEGSEAWAAKASKTD